MNTLSSLLNFIGGKISDYMTIKPSIGVVELSQANVSALPLTLSNAAITSNHVVVASELSNPSAQTGDWTVTTSTGQAVISGTISGTTDVLIRLGAKIN